MGNGMNFLKELIMNTKLWIRGAGLCFFLIILLGIAGNLISSKVQLDPALARKAGIITILVFLLLGLGLMFSAIPVMVRIVLGFQEKIGNGHVPIIAFFLRHEAGIVLIYWSIFLAGLLVGGPYFLRDMLKNQ